MLRWRWTERQTDIKIYEDRHRGDRCRERKEGRRE